MTGIDPYAYMRQVATQMDRLEQPSDIERVLDELEYLFEVIPPELQGPAEQLILQLRRKLADSALADSG